MSHKVEVIQWCNVHHSSGCTSRNGGMMRHERELARSHGSLHLSRLDPLLVLFILDQYIGPVLSCHSYLSKMTNEMCSLLLMQFMLVV